MQLSGLLRMINFTGIQKNILRKYGIFVIKSCPGSGKTLTVAARLNKYYRRWPYTHRGIATISFTNVAWQEINKYLFEEFDINRSISYPHFLGSIDSFINNYIFLPFGNLIMNCTNRPKFIGPPYNEWDPIETEHFFWRNGECNRYCKINSFSYNKDDDLTDFSPRNHFNNCNSNHVYCRRLKKQINEAGYATQLDANYFALKVLGKFPNIAKALAYRFPIFMIDEVQDTSEIQMKIIDLLIEAGLSKVMFIGDPDQSIYEWRTANAQLLVDKFNEYSSNSLEFNENWRSSEKICKFTYKLSSLSRVSEAKNNDVKNFTTTPQIWGYNNISNLDRIINDFLSLCTSNGLNLNSNDIAILVRSENLLKTISGYNPRNFNKNPWNDIFTKELARAKYLFDSGDYKSGLNLLERVICKKKLNKITINKMELRTYIEEYGFLMWRKNIWNFMIGLPKTNINLGNWVEQAKVFLTGQTLISSVIAKVKNRNEYKILTFNEIFKTERKKIAKNNYVIGTIHSVKGETFEAVLIILKEKTANNKIYINLLDENIQENEELRIVYVGMTRPRKILVLAVPDQTNKLAWEKKLL